MAKAPIKQLVAGGMVAILLASAPLSAQMVKPPPRYDLYENLTVAELISAYKDAYVRAGFRFKELLVEKPRGRSVWSLRFEFPNPRFPEGRKAITNLTVTSANSETVCSPCRMYEGSLTGYLHDAYDAEEYVRYAADVGTARQNAESDVKAKLAAYLKRS
jgi:hypothetical protein